jgi:hypothetical protein
MYSYLHMYTNMYVGVCDKVLHDCSVSSEVLKMRREALLILGTEYCKVSVSSSAGLEDLVAKMGQQSGMYGPKDTTVVSTNPDECTEFEDDEIQEKNEEKKSEKFGNNGSHKGGKKKRNFPNPFSKGYNDETDNDAYNYSDVDSDTVHEEKKKEENNVIFSSECILNELKNLSTYKIKELKNKILFYNQDKKSKTNFLEKKDMEKYLKSILLVKLDIVDLRILLNSEISEQNISEKVTGKGVY